MMEELSSQPKEPLNNTVTKTRTTEQILKEKKQSEKTSYQILLDTRNKLENIMNRLNLKLPNPKQSSPIPIVVREPSNTSSDVLVIPAANNGIDDGIRLMNLQNEISSRSPLSINDWKSFSVRNLNSDSGVFTHPDPLLIFSAFVFDFISQKNPKLFTELRLMVLSADPSTFNLGGFNEKLKEGNTGQPMPPDDAKMTLVTLASEIRTKSTLKLLEISEAFESFLVGLVCYIHNVRLKINTESLPKEYEPAELFASFARAFDLKYERQELPDGALNVFSYEGSSFKIKEFEEGFTGSFDA